MFSFNDPDTADQLKGIAFCATVAVGVLIAVFFTGAAVNAFNNRQITNRAEKAVACIKELGPENAQLCQEIYQVKIQP
ncbi:hypothetical protein EBZ02_04880 [bacterium]|nr:hypothetical protein [bacterium]NDA09843.1 hypothetical protein [Verrucomicrobiota bacterium]NDA25977.1 hypothetical protein [Verrucomicrobiota bacterium]NDD81655.1 hypothetical protein [Verrucomicrobiota bacterium]